MPTDYWAQHTKRLYDEYAEGVRHLASVSESGAERPVSFEEFSKLPLSKQLAGAYITPDEDDPFVQQFKEKFGDPPAFDNFELNNEKQTGYRIGVDDGSNGVSGPGYGRADWNQFAQDPSRILWIDPPGTPERRFIFEAGNGRGDVVAAEQERDSNSGLGDGTNWALAALAVVGGGGLLTNALTAAPSAAGATAAGAAGGESALGTGLLNAADYTVAAASPTLSAAPPLIGAGAAPAAAASGGLVDGIVNAGRSAMSWVNNLSPAARTILGSAISSGASAAINSNAVSRQIEARRNEEERANERYNERHQVAPTKPGAFSAKPIAGGLINSRVNGG